MSDWFDNDEVFFRELDVGHKWAEVVTGRLREHGVPAEQTDKVVREHVDDRHDFADEIDVQVHLPNGTFLIECKSRDLAFTNDPATYPFSTAFVDTVSGWERKTSKPRAVVLISQRTGALLVINVKATEASWTTIRKFDRIRKINDQWLQAPKSRLSTFDWLVRFLQSELNAKAAEVPGPDSR